MEVGNFLANIAEEAPNILPEEALHVLGKFVQPILLGNFAQLLLDHFPKALDVLVQFAGTAFRLAADVAFL